MRSLTNTPQRRRQADGQLSSHCPTSPSFSSFGAACVMLCCFPPASSSTPLRPSVNYPSISLVVNMKCIRTFCDHQQELYIFDQTGIVLKSGWNSTARIPRLVRRADSLFLRPASLPTSSSLPRFLLPPRPHFLRPASLPPSFSSTPPSILHLPSPSRRFGLSCKASSWYVVFI